MLPTVAASLRAGTTTATVWVPFASSSDVTGQSDAWDNRRSNQARTWASTYATLGVTTEQLIQRGRGKRPDEAPATLPGVSLEAHRGPGANSVPRKTRER